jgi:hypothetical protein
MNKDEFDEVVDEVFERCATILEEKGNIYASDDDRFENFNTTAKDQEILPEEALRGMLGKHVTAVNKYITKLSQGENTSKELWEASIFDCINYYLLLYGMLRNEGDV